MAKTTSRQRRERARAAANKRWEKARAAAPKVVAPTPARTKVSDYAVAASRGRTGAAAPKAPIDIFAPAKFPKSATPKTGQMAMDSTDMSWAYALFSGVAAEGQTFLGYPYLSELSQRPEYRRMVEQLAYHMTRRWIRLKDKSATPDAPDRTGLDDEGPLAGEPGFEAYQAELAAKGTAANPKAGARANGKVDPKAAQDAFPPPKPGANGAGQDDDAPQMDPNGRPLELNAAGEPHVEPLHTQADKEREERAKKLTDLEKELKRLRVKQLFKEVVEQDGFFGRSHIYIDLGTTDQPNELATPIGNGKDDASKLKVRKGSLRGLKTVEPMWVYPMGYEASDPLAPNWYRPDTWYVMKRQVHRSRLLTFVSREVPDLLKPAYAFGGLPLTQIAKPYVDNWLRTRQSVADLVQSFSQMVLKTDLLAQMSSAEGSTNLFKRLDVFNNTRNNRGVMAIDKEREEFENVTAPLGSLDKLQAQSQEHMSSVSGIPIMFLLGDQPTGLNASSEGSIRAFYDWVQASQEFLFEKPLDALIAMAQLNLWGEVDEDITYEFVQLWTPTDKELAEQRKTDADRDTAYIDAGVVDAEEVREKLAADPNSGYTLDLTKKIEPPAPDVKIGPDGKPIVEGMPGQQGGDDNDTRPPGLQ